MYADLSTLTPIPSDTAFFFDFDGTLAEIVDDPSAVRIDRSVVEALAALREMSGGAVAILSGREIAALDAFLAPLQLPLGGSHGSERRGADGRVQRVVADDAVIGRVAAALEDVAQRHEGLLVERKRLSVALHYRQRPDLETLSRATVLDLATGHGLTLLEGKMVAELKLSARTKGDLIDEFMSENPFRGRQPIFFGDDVTDEDAFRILPRWDGIGVKVGTGPTAATRRIPNPAALHVWLRRMTANRNGTTRVELARQ